MKKNNLSLCVCVIIVLISLTEMIYCMNWYSKKKKKGIKSKQTKLKFKYI